MAGDKVKAKAAYEEFFRLWKDADTGMPIRERARAAYMNLGR
jgi:hypothetical protein